MFELDVELGQDFGADEVAKGDDVGGSGVAAIDEGEGVAGGDSGGAIWMGSEAFVEAGAFEEPGGREFDEIVGCGPVGDVGGG